MLDFPLVDTHLHLWDTGRLRYPWLDDIPALNRPFLLEDYQRACGPVAVERMIFLQCECAPAQYAEEAAWVASLAKEDPRIEGIVPWAPLEKGRAAREEVEALGYNPLVKGIRRIIQFEPDPEFCLRPDFVEGVRMLPELGLHFEITIAEAHLENTLKFVRRCPEVRFMLDHCAKPRIADGVLDPWRKYIAQLAEMSNVWCKLSGLTTEADHQTWTREDLKPYVDHVMACFGPDRIVFGGDWPVATLATDYPRWVETVEWSLAGCTRDELRKVFHDNAVAFYRL